jgi:four helix bundle protein
MHSSAHNPAIENAPTAMSTHVSLSDEPRLDAEKLTVYRLALDLQQLASILGSPTHRVLYDQLERASISIVTNLAEGAGRHSTRDKRRFYAISRGSAMETAALIDVLRVRRLAPDSMCNKARNLALRVIQLLTKLHASLL